MYCICWIYFCQNQKKTIIFDSFPDFSGNSYIFFKFLENEMPEKKFIWLVKDFKNIELYLKKLKKDNISSSNIYFVKKNNPKSIFLYLTTKLVITNIGIIKGLKIPKNHIVINLWHGMPIKAIGKKLNENFLNKNKEEKLKLYFSYVLSTSELYNKILMDCFEIKLNQVLQFGLPRNDLLIKKKF